MGKEPDEIRAEIERTRAELGRDVDTLTEKVSPSRVVERRVGRVRASVANTKEEIMGTADTVGAAPEYAKARAQGNPFAAGLVAFGAGWLASTLFPSTRVEQRAGQQLKEQAGALVEPVKEQLTRAATEMKDTLQAQAEQVKSRG